MIKKIEVSEVLKAKIIDMRKIMNTDDIQKITKVPRKRILLICKDLSKEERFYKKPEGKIRGPNKVKKPKKEVVHKPKTFETLKQDLSLYRKISMFDTRNTIRYIKTSDKRSDEEIRTEWNKEQRRKLLDLKN